LDRRRIDWAISVLEPYHVAGGIIPNTMKVTVALMIALTAITATRRIGSETLAVERLFFVVSDLERSTAFYRDVVGLELIRPTTRMGAQVSEMYGAPGVAMDAVNFSLPGRGSNGTDSLQLLTFHTAHPPIIMPRLQDAGAVRLVLKLKTLSPVLARLKANHVPALLPGQLSVKENESLADPPLAVVQDPDGFFIELQKTNDSPATVSGILISAELGLTVRRTDEALKLWRDVLGFEAEAGRWEKGSKAHSHIASLVGSSFRQSRVELPGSNLPIDLIEFRENRKPRSQPIRALQHPGAANIQLRVTDLNRVKRELVALGSEFVISGGPSITFQDRLLVATVRTPDRLFIEATQIMPSLEK
jgi:catechol 2,3-dioxygenase-like lactoylglutathione lyase family enzyme